MRRLGSIYAATPATTHDYRTPYASVYNFNEEEHIPPCATQPHQYCSSQWSAKGNVLSRHRTQAILRPNSPVVPAFAYSDQVCSTYKTYPVRASLKALDF